MNLCRKTNEPITIESPVHGIKGVNMRPFKFRTLTFITSGWLIASTALPVQAEDTTTHNKAENQKAPSYFAPVSGEQINRNVFWRPALSLFLPGIDQYLAGQWAYGLGYSSVWMASSAWAANRNREADEREAEWDFNRLTDIERENEQIHNELYKQRTLANQLVLAAGGMSAYHSFRTAVATHQPHGGYEFLVEEETPLDILRAPFEFSHLKKPTTWVPLALITGLAVLDANTQQEDYTSDPYSSSDAFYTGAISYNAGTYEEAIFRGWIMPVAMEKTHSLFWSNFLQAAMFAAAHLNQIATPYVQFGLGYYLGWLTQQSRWTLSESIFIHAWWDVAALTIQYQNRKQDPLAPQAVVWLPPLKMVF
jgi:hypothetical protein